MKNPRLKKGAIPSVFPNCPSYLTTTKRKQKCPKKRTPLDESAKPESNDVKKINVADLEEAKDFVNSNVISNEKTPGPEKPGAPEIFKNLKDSEVAERSYLFNSLFISSDSIKMPISWCRRQCYKSFTCIELMQSTCRLVNGKKKFLTLKQIMVSNNMRIRAEVSGIALPLEKLGLTDTYISSVGELEALIVNFDNFRVCSGCASPDSVTNIENSFEIRDPSGHLRHLKCSLLIPIGTESLSCERCTKGKRTLRKKGIRLQRITEQRRLIFHMSPSKKEKLQLLRTRLYKSNRRIGNYQRLYHHY